MVRDKILLLQKKFQSVSRGFTLIELVVVFSIIAVLSTIGLAAFNEFNKGQILKNDTYNVVNALTTAKLDAQSQLKPSVGVCVDTVLNGYKVIIDANTKTYGIYAVCGGTDYLIPDSEKTLSSAVSFTQDSSHTFFFQVLLGTVDGASSNGTNVTLEAFGKQEIVSVFSDGRIVRE